ncbi:hypothetical protein GSY69_02480 [Brevibacterium sp. 5221]|uniref:HdeD family acid-resistance protein n=1 Tax=Brevibacterium rongguiense TaxID=2695267 RepID=A0A6N9H512_9MICO|nr:MULTISPECIES: DUF308 domain-containing protein [Brevibacterium]MYM18876.1 hypothetical protein [Brevibacterium rongguiense]WAL39391.1 DUF308 domain-containing protein [Brevibacterium sp. BRM-1]
MTSPLMPTAGTVLRKMRTLLFVQGAAALVLGVLVIIWPVNATLIFAILMGAWLLVDGVVSALTWAARPRGARSGVALARAIFGIVAGLVIVAVPAAGMLVVVWIVAFVMLLLGAFQLAGCGTLRAAGVRYWWMMLITGILSVLAAVGILLFPVTGAAVFAWIVGVAMIVEGIAAFLIGSQLNRAVRAQDEREIPGELA